MAKIPANLYIIHLALMLSPALFAAVVYFAVLPGEAGDAVSKDQTRIFQTVGAAFAVIGVGMSQLVPRFMMRAAKQIAMRQYISMKIVQWALLEGSALFIGVVFFMTHEKSMLIPLGVLIAILALLRPTVDELIRFNVKD